MTPSIDLSLSLAADGSALPSLFFRPADRLRLEACVAALTEESRSVALSSLHDAALDHYGKLLTERLRRACPQGRIETYFPTSTEALVHQFNEVLARQTLREAMTEGMARGDQRIWVIHDAGVLAEHELQLMVRLVSHFPGANIRVVLLMGPNLRSRKAFDSLGRRFVRWDIEAPTFEQAQAMLEQARIEGCESPVSQLLRHLQPEAVSRPEAVARAAEPFSFQAVDARTAEPPASPRVPVWQQRLRALGGELQRRSASLRDRAFSLRLRLRPMKSPPQPARRSEPVASLPASPPGRAIARWRWALAVTGLVALSVALSAWLHGAGFGQPKAAVQQPVKAERGAAGLEIKPAVSREDPPATSLRTRS